MQLLVIDECNGHQMFNTKSLEDTKRLFEGRGKMIQNKNMHAFRGFEDCYTLLTMNNLPYPFVEKKVEPTEEETERRECDLGSFNTRVKRFHLTNSF